MRFFPAFIRSVRLLAEEFFSLLIVGIVGGALMLSFVAIPFVLGGYAAMADDLSERRPISLGYWWAGARAMARRAYLWAALNLVGWLLLLLALNVYGQVDGIGRALQGTVLVMSYLWYVVLLYYLPLARLRPEDEWRETLRRSALLLLTTPFDTLFLMLVLGMLAVPLLLTNPILMLFHPLFAILFATVLVRVHLGLSAAVEEEDLADKG